MAHILDGDWRSFQIKDGDPTNDEGFHLEIDPASGDIKQGSKHGALDITGDAHQGSVFHRIFIKQAGPPKRNYLGILVLNGPSMMICGLLNLNPQFLLEKEKVLTDREFFALFEQEQEIWVATKP